MAQADYSIANQGFPATRAEINSTLEAIATNNSGTSAPSTQYAGQFWIDTTSSTWTLYIHDGTDDIQFATIDTSANTVNFTDSALDVVTDTTPQLGGDLDLNSNDITGTGDINITGDITATNLSGTLPISNLSGLTNFKNIVINGDMSIAQRGTSTSGVSTTGNFVLDRWKLNVDGMGAWTVSQSTDVPTGQGFANSIKWDCTTADASPSASGNILFQQRFEGQNLQYLKKGTSSAESLTLSFWVKSNKTGTYIAELRDKDNSDRHINKSYTISSADTWEKKTITFAGDTTGTLTNDNSTSIDLNFWLGAGTNWTSGTLQTSWSASTSANRAVGQVNLADDTANEWYITGVQLEAGTSSSDFEFLPFDVNTQRCLRYYQKSYAYGTALGTATSAGAYFSAFTINASNQNYHTVNLQSIMRTSPTVVFYSTSTGATGKYRNDSDAADYNATLSSISDKMLRFRPSSSTGVNDGDRFSFQFTLDAEL